MLMSPSRSSSFYCQLSCVSFVLLLTFYFTYLNLLTSTASMSRATSASSEQPAASAAMRRVDFEVFGKVQGVFFRKYTQEQAKQIGVRGWIRNTKKQTVQGQIEGEAKKVEQMKEWLRSTGSPQSKIQKAVFSQETDIEEFSFKSFDVRN